MRCSPVKNGWHLEHISTLNSDLDEPVTKLLPHEHVTCAVGKYSGCISGFIVLIFYRVDACAFSTATSEFIFHGAIDKCEKCVVFSNADVLSGAYLGASLSD